MEDFFLSLEDFGRWPVTKRVDYITYYLLKVEGQESVTAKQIKDVEIRLNLKPYGRLPQYLSTNVKARNGKYVKIKSGGYKLEHNAFKEIDNKMGDEPTRVAASAQLSSLAEKIADEKEKGFLEEAINCYSVKANRATIIMTWLVAMNHMHKYVFENELDEFNQAFALNPEKKMNKITKLDDFSALSEDKFILLMKSGNIISNDVRKLLDEKLGTRNSAAHPSGVEITSHKATEFVLDIVQNVLLKY